MRIVKRNIAFVLVCLLLVPSVLLAMPDTEKGTSENRPGTIGNREEPHEEQILAFMKGFLGALRDDHRGDPVRDAETFRGWIDPTYLDQHGLAEGGLPMKTIDFLNMVTINVADDGRTVLCVVEPEDRSELVALFRVVQRSNAIYIQPFAAPEQDSGSFNPWMLLMDAEDWMPRRH